MLAVTDSPKFQVVTLLAVREATGLMPGIKLLVVNYESHIQLVPMRFAKTLRSTLKGLDTEMPRERDRV